MLAGTHNTKVCIYCQGAKEPVASRAY